MATNPKIEFRLPPIMHAYLEDLANMGAFGNGKTGVAKRFVELGVMNALDKKVIESRSIADFDVDTDDD